MTGFNKFYSKEKTYDILKLPNFIAVESGKPIRFIIYVSEGEECEIIALYRAVEKRGIATNDNTRALRFYQKRGFTIAAFRPNAIEAQRKLKPIPLFGADGIPIRDEIELEIIL